MNAANAPLRSVTSAVVIASACCQPSSPRYIGNRKIKQARNNKPTRSVNLVTGFPNSKLVRRVGAGHNVTHVLRGEMERISTDEWSPNMCRDQYGRVFNQPHALGGVGEMFRGLLEHDGRSSQFRTWREIDGTHELEDMRKFLGYKRALDQFLLTANHG